MTIIPMFVSEGYDKTVMTVFVLTDHETIVFEIKDLNGDEIKSIYLSKADCKKMVERINNLVNNG